MTLAKRANSGDVIWMRRSVARLENVPSDRAAETKMYSAGVRLIVGRDLQGNNAPILDVRVSIEIKDSLFEAFFDVKARFVFGGDRKIPEETELRDFVRDYGIDYAFGFIRAALADDLRVFGLSPAILPPTALDDAKASELTLVHSEDIMSYEPQA
ncbi:hypothetical protein [Nocardia sp. NBC_01327]|uniref:hypothetical protein n=1 Tax=Nocardia sp. NBC_01327 TaxID=2903593 RepID=UPI002E11F63C|nr:hypothetical protein OG326_23630 [Nocardia sp. NBC_01327]